MTFSGFHGRLLMAVSAGYLAFGAVPARATAVTVNDPFNQLFNVGVNSLGFVSGARIRYGATSVTPNGNNGTTGSATTFNTVTNAQVVRNIVFNPSPLLPNFFTGSIAYNSQLLGPWTVTFSNGGDSTVTNFSFPTGAQLPPFVTNITLSGTSESLSGNITGDCIAFAA